MYFGGPAKLCSNMQNSVLKIVPIGVVLCMICARATASEPNGRRTNCGSSAIEIVLKRFGSLVSPDGLHQEFKFDEEVWLEDLGRIFREEGLITESFAGNQFGSSYVRRQLRRVGDGQVQALVLVKTPNRSNHYWVVSDFSDERITVIDPLSVDEIGSQITPEIVDSILAVQFVYRRWDFLLSRPLGPADWVWMCCMVGILGFFSKRRPDRRDETQHSSY